MLTLTNRIDMRPGAVPLVIHRGQYDSDFSLVFELYSSAGNFTVESGTTAMIRGTKTDGHAYDADATIDVSAKTVTVAGNEQMTAAKGRNVYELVLTKSGKVLSTANFILDVERAAMDADTIASESVLKELNAIIAGAETATEAAQTATAAAESVSGSAAQIATNTADIADLKADFEQLEPGLSAEAKAALLTCFRHVVWTDHDDDYYNNLEEALEDEPTSLSSISATYTQGATVVYPFDTLDSLKQNLVVVAHYNDESQEVVSDYTLTGDLDNSSSVVTVAYRNKATTFTVDVTVDSALVYYVKRGTVLPGDSNDSIINTEYAPGSTNKAITIVCDFMDDLIAPRTTGTIIYNNVDGGGYYAVSNRVANDSTYTKSYFMNCYGAGSRNITGLSDAPHRVRFAFTHAANTKYVYGSMYVDDTVVCTNVEMSATYKTSDNILALGGRLTGGYWGRGTFNLFAVYERVLSQAEIKSLLEVS